MIYLLELARDYLNKHTNFHVFSGIISPVSDLYPTSKKLVSAKHRCEMVKRALVPFKGEQHWVKVCTWESEQDAWFRTCRVLKYQIELHKKNNENICVKLLCGSDLFETFNVPNLWADEDIEFICKNGMIVITRDGYDPFKTLNESEKSSILLKYKVVLTLCLTNYNLNFYYDRTALILFMKKCIMQSVQLLLGNKNFCMKKEIID